MGLMTFANKFDEKTPKQKMMFVGVSVLIFLCVLGAVFYMGAVSWRGYSDSKYLREREETLKKVEAAETKAGEFEKSANRHIENEKQLSAENEILKRQNEATAEILKANDAKIQGDAKKFDDLNKQRQQKFDEINADEDFDNQVKGLCADAEKSGFKLSDTLCGRFKGK